MRKKTEIHLAYIYIAYAVKGNELAEGKYNLWDCKSSEDNYIITIGRKRLHAKWINFHVLINISQFTPNGSHEILLWIENIEVYNVKLCKKTIEGWKATKQLIICFGLRWKVKSIRGYNHDTLWIDSILCQTIKATCDIKNKHSTSTEGWYMCQKNKNREIPKQDPKDNYCRNLKRH